MITPLSCTMGNSRQTGILHARIKSGIIIDTYSAVQSQKAVFAYLTREQIPPFGSAEQYSEAIHPVVYRRTTIDRERFHPSQPNKHKTFL